MTEDPVFAAEAQVKKPADLSAEIARQVEKRPNDRVTCRRISGDTYRCNWWAPASISGYDNPAMAGLTVTTHRVRKSQCLNVTRASQELLIREKARQ